MRAPGSSTWLVGTAVILCVSLPSCASLDVPSVAERLAAWAAEQPEAPPATRPARPSGRTTSTSPANARRRPATLPAGLELTAQQAIVVAIQHNRELAVQTLNPQIARTLAQQELAAFDPLLTTRAAYSRTRVPSTRPTEGATASVGLKEFLPTGTTVELAGRSGVTQGDFGEADTWDSGVDLNVTQALLRGGGLAVNLAGVRQTRLDVLTSEQELRGFAQDVVAAVEKSYWEHVLAVRAMEIVQNSLQLAEQQEADIRERIRLGKLAEIELAAAQAEVALRHEELIDARSNLETTRLTMLRLLSPPGARLSDTHLSLASLPTIPELSLESPEQQVERAMRRRPDLEQARLLVQRSELELVRTRNGLLPRLDVFINLGASGYADSFRKSVREAGDHNYDVLVGVSGEYPLANLEARSRHRQATLNREQAELAVANLEQLAEVDVRTAYIELSRSAEQVRATAATRHLQEATLRSELEKFRLQKSTSLLVARAQRDLLSRSLAEVQAVVSSLKALVELQRVTGSLLDDLGITTAGG